MSHSTFWSFATAFGLENLTLQTGEIPAPGPREVLLEVGAAALNYRDLVVMRGQHGRAVTPPLIPLSDGVGRVIAVGAEADPALLGTRVCPSFFLNWPSGPPPANLEEARLGGPLQGLLTTHATFPADMVVPVPDHLSDAEAATLPCAGVTAWSAIFGTDPLHPGQTVLIQGSGGVALMALHLAKAAGARTILTTSSPDRAARLTALGADHVIDRSETPGWASAVRELTAGEGCHRILELGGAETLPQSLKAARTGATILLIGNVTGNRAEVFLPAILTRQLTLRAVTVGPRDALTGLARTLAQHQIHPTVAQVFPFGDAPEAFKALETGSPFGNICIAP